MILKRFVSSGRAVRILAERVLSEQENARMYDVCWVTRT